MQKDAPDIPGYTIQQLLGTGGMARVYLAIQRSFDRRVALKIISDTLASNPEFGRRFLREARIVGSLSHPHIIPVYDVGEHEGLYYLAMELFTAGDLRDRLRRPLSERTALEITRQLASALGFAHQRGFVHRDIKPDNVLFRDTGEAVLTDFGIARPTQGGADVTEITQVESVIGSPKYMSPEQSVGASVDGRSDIYSLGVLAYQMLLGELPFMGNNLAELSIARKETQVPLLPDQFAHLQPLINGMLAYDRDERFVDCAHIQSAVDDLLTRQPVIGRPGSPDPQAVTLVAGVAQTRDRGRINGGHRPSVFTPARAIGAVVLCVVSGVAGLAFYRQTPSNVSDAPSAQLSQAPADAGLAPPGKPVVEGPGSTGGAPLETPTPKEFYAFYDAVNGGLTELERSFIGTYPDSIFADILRVKLADNKALFDAMKQRADSGDARAQLVVSELYDTGWAGERNQSRAMDYARKAASSDNPFAQYHLAMLVLASAQTDEERREGIKALQESSENGFFLAQTMLANHLLEGRLLGRDVEESLALLETAGNQGDRNALFNLARILDSGLHLEQAEPEKARRYFERAAQLGLIKARDYLNEP